VPASLLERRLHFVAGKGGVGKTTVAAALALALVRRGERTLAVEMDGAGRLAAVLGPRPEIGSRLHVLAVDGKAALEEYLSLIIPVKRLLATVFASRIYQYFVAAAPGLKELMTVGKIWYEATRTEGGRPAWDAIVVDAPATGHSLQYLRMPQAARETFGVGLVQREATRIVELLRDPRITAVHLVTLAEEMPVSETLEARAQLLRTLGLPVGYVVVNRLHRRRFDPSLLERLRAAARTAPAGDRALLACVAERAAEESGWSEINATYIDRLRAGIGEAPLVELPFLFVEEFGPEALDRLSLLLEAGMGGRAETVARRRSRSPCRSASWSPATGS
jgi:anion-transporting  ArsA/GET3 family ATPase